MSASVCTECGAAVDEAAERCANCGAELEARRLHEGSDVRIESDRLADLSGELSLPTGRWGRASDHPGPPSDSALFADGNGAGETPNTPASDATHEPPMSRPERVSEPRASRPGLQTPSAELAHLMTHDGIASPPPSAAGESRAFAGISSTGSHETLTTTGSHPTITTTGSHPTITTTGSNPTQPRRPPVLASEALLRDLAPSRPARRALRIWCPILGVLGASVAWFMTKGQGTGWPLAGAFAGVALLGLPPMPYSGRASAVATVSGTALALVLWTDAGDPDGLAAVLLTISVTLLAAGLYFRAWHRASILARFIVTAGVIAGATYLWMRGDVSDLTLTDIAWQSWLPRAIGLAFGILLMLALLVFMDARSTGGSAVWASFVLCWYGFDAAAEILRAAWPKDADGPDLSRIPVDTLLAWTSAPILTALLSLGLAQLMASGLAQMSSRRAETFHFGSHAKPEFGPTRSARGPT